MGIFDFFKKKEVKARNYHYDSYDNSLRDAFENDPDAMWGRLD